MQTLREAIGQEMAIHSESWADEIAFAGDMAVLDRAVEQAAYGMRFTLWTTRRVYFFFANEGGFCWGIYSVPRNPCDEIIDFNE
jgi:hypothetical protein